MKPYLLKVLPLALGGGNGAWGPVRNLHGFFKGSKIHHGSSLKWLKDVGHFCIWTTGVVQTTHLSKWKNLGVKILGFLICDVSGKVAGSLNPC